MVLDCHNEGGIVEFITAGVYDSGYCPVIAVVDLGAESSWNQELGDNLQRPLLTNFTSQFLPPNGSIPSLKQYHHLRNKHSEYKPERAISNSTPNRHRHS